MTAFKKIAPANTLLSTQTLIHTFDDKELLFQQKALHGKTLLNEIYSADHILKVII